MADDQKVPSFMQMIAHIADDVAIASVFRWEKIARPCFVATRVESASNRAGKLARDKHAHGCRCSPAQSSLPSATFHTPSPNGSNGPRWSDWRILARQWGFRAVFGFSANSR